MTIELSRQVDKDLRAAVAGLEMEVSDSVMEYLLASIAAGLAETGKNGSDGMVLLAMQSVAEHVDVLRSRSDPDAFNLVVELWQTFEKIRDGLDEDGARELAATEVEKVLAWQRRCFMDSCRQETNAPPAVNAVLPVSVMELLDRHLAETREYVSQELKALREATVMVSLGTSLQRAGSEPQLYPTVGEQICGLEELLREEMSNLRQELQSGGNRV